MLRKSWGLGIFQKWNYYKEEKKSSGISLTTQKLVAIVLAIFCYTMTDIKERDWTNNVSLEVKTNNFNARKKNVMTQKE